MTRTINLSNTQFRYQIVFFIHIHVYGYVWLAEGCHWHLLPRQNFTTSQIYGNVRVVEKCITHAVPSICIKMA